MDAAQVTGRIRSLPALNRGPEFESVFVRIPSSAAGEEGLAASRLLPHRIRFPTSAPVVVHVAGGVRAGNACGRPEYAGHWFVEIHFAFPGGGRDEERSPHYPYPRHRKRRFSGNAMARSPIP